MTEHNNPLFDPKALGKALEILSHDGKGEFPVTGKIIEVGEYPDMLNKFPKLKINARAYYRIIFPRKKHLYLFFFPDKNERYAYIPASSIATWTGKGKDDWTNVKWKFNSK